MKSAFTENSRFLGFYLSACLLTACTNNPFGSAALPNGFAPGVLTDVPLSLQSISPANGPFTGGTLMTLMGAGFTSQTVVTVGNLSCLNLTLISSTQLTCITPFHSPGSVTVTVTNSGSSSQLAQAFVFLPGDNLPRAKFAALNGGGVSSATDGSIHLRGSAGGSGAKIQTGSGIISHNGLQGALNSY